MKIEIKRWDTGAVILCGEYEDIRDCLQRNKSANLFGANLSGSDLSGANLSRANLSGANLSGANLSRANLSVVNLSGVNLSRANLSGANLTWANLSGANLSGANLSWANLSGANLSGANLSRANLSGVNLSRANLSGADLTEADLSKIMIPPPMFLLAQWGNVSDALCVDLMRYDAANHPNPEKFIEWAKSGNCPYSDISILRSANFTEKRELIPPGFLSLPVKSAYELMQALIAEKGKK